MLQSPFGRVLSEREVAHRRRMLAHLRSVSGTTPVEPPPSSHPPVIAFQRREDLLHRGRVIPFCSRAME